MIKKGRHYTMNNIGVVTEQGDLGLGFSPISESEQETLAKNQQLNNNEEEK